MFSGMRWTEASSCPLSHVYGQPGDRFVLVEAIATQGTGAFPFFLGVGVGRLCMCVYACWCQDYQSGKGGLVDRATRFVVFPPHSRRLYTYNGHVRADGWEEYIGRVFDRWRQMRSTKDGSLPRPHWAKWDARWIPGLVPYIKVGVGL
jgi:hypothetical protein